MSPGLLRFIKNLEILDSVAVRLTVLSGKSPYPVHPKHLLNTGPVWFEKYLEKKDVVLDLGCDNGMHTLKAARRVRSIIGIDYLSRSLEVAKKMAVLQKIKNAKFLQASLEVNLKFPSNSFDKVLFLDVLEHLNNRKMIMHECERILKRGGLLLLSIPNSDTGWKKLLRKHGINSFADEDHKFEYTKPEAIKICKDAHLELISINPITLDTPISPIIGLVGGMSLDLYRILMKWKQNQMSKHPEETVGFRIVARKI